jgi:GT2 family glycosyltransferase
VRLSVAAVVVTYNREQELAKTLSAYCEIAERGDINYLIVVDNFSTDGTARVVDEFSGRFQGKLIYVCTGRNLGGAGGFRIGVEKCLALDVEWVWLSDDDAVPDVDCIAAISKVSPDKAHLYGGVALVNDSAEKELCWPAPVRKADKFVLARYINQLDEISDVGMLPFLGFLISKDKICEIGLPNSNYFISGDDVEYCIKAFSTGSRLFQVRGSRLLHPRINRYTVTILGKEFFCLAMPPWRRYFDVRNRIWNARLAFGLFGGGKTVASLFLRLLFSLIIEKDRAEQVASSMKGGSAGIFKYNQVHSRSGILK